MKEEESDFGKTTGQGVGRYNMYFVQPGTGREKPPDVGRIRDLLGSSRTPINSPGGTPLGHWLCCYKTVSKPRSPSPLRALSSSLRRLCSDINISD